MGFKAKWVGLSTEAISGTEFDEVLIFENVSLYRKIGELASSKIAFAF